MHSLNTAKEGSILQEQNKKGQRVPTHQPPLVPHVDRLLRPAPPQLRCDSHPFAGVRLAQGYQLSIFGLGPRPLFSE